MCSPAISFLSADSFSIQILGDVLCSTACQHLIKNPANVLGLLGIYNHLLTVPIIAVGWVADLEGSVFEAFLDRPFAVLRDGYRLAFSHAA